MKAIINKKLYDTDKATEIFSTLDQYLGSTLGIDLIRSRRTKIYKTKNGNYFMTCNTQIIKTMSEKEVKEYILNKDIEKYLKLFGSDGIEEG